MIEMIDDGQKVNDISRIIEIMSCGTLIPDQPVGSVNLSHFMISVFTVPSLRVQRPRCRPGPGRWMRAAAGATLVQMLAFGTDGLQPPKIVGRTRGSLEGCPSG